MSAMTGRTRTGDRTDSARAQATSPVDARDGRGTRIILPPRIRVSLAQEDAPAGLGPGTSATMSAMTGRTRTGDRTDSARAQATSSPASIRQVPVMLGGGIAAWFVLPDPVTWCAAALLVAGVALAVSSEMRHDIWRRGRLMLGAAAAEWAIEIHDWEYARAGTCRHSPARTTS
jgi:hypothetical protein